MTQETWSKSTKKHQRSFTCGDEEVFHDKISNTPKGLNDSSSGQQGASIVINKLKLKHIQLFQPDIIDSKTYTPRPPRNIMAKGEKKKKGDTTNRTDRSDKGDKTTRQLSRDLEKVQRIIEIDNDIIKSQIKNLNNEYKSKRDNIEVQNKLLIDKTVRLQNVVVEDRRQLTKFKEVFEKTILYF